MVRACCHCHFAEAFDKVCESFFEIVCGGLDDIAALFCDCLQKLVHFPEISRDGALSEMIISFKARSFSL